MKNKLISKTCHAGFVLAASAVLTLTGCEGYVSTPGADVAVSAPGVVVQDDYVYYPSYGIYYNNTRHNYAYREGNAWVSRPAPRGVSVDAVRASPSVRMDFHDSPANHHDAVVRQYPKNWQAPHVAKR
jgi:hypothetical protein